MNGAIHRLHQRLLFGSELRIITCFHEVILRIACASQPQAPFEHTNARAVLRPYASPDYVASRKQRGVFDWNGASLLHGEGAHDYWKRWLAQTGISRLDDGTGARLGLGSANPEIKQMLSFTPTGDDNWYYVQRL